MGIKIYGELSGFLMKKEILVQLHMCEPYQLTCWTAGSSSWIALQALQLLTWTDTDCAGSGALSGSLVSTVSPGSLLNERPEASRWHTHLPPPAGSFYRLTLDAEDLGHCRTCSERLTSAVATVCWLTPIRASLTFPFSEEFHVWACLNWHFGSKTWLFLMLSTGTSYLLCVL